MGRYFTRIYGRRGNAVEDIAEPLKAKQIAIRLGLPWIAHVLSKVVPIVKTQNEKF